MKPLQAVLIIILFTLLLSGTTGVVLFYHVIEQNNRSQDPAYTISAVVQKAMGRNVLPTAALIEMLNLSKDHPMNLYAFHVKSAAEKLVEKGIFKRINISKVIPDTLLIEYSLRDPIAYLEDYTNTALDVEGAIFPFHPYYTPKKIPSVRFGKELLRGAQLDEKELKLMLEVFALLEAPAQNLRASLQKLDITKAINPKDPLNEIDVLMTYGGRERWLRLTHANMTNELADFLIFQQTLLDWEDKHPSSKTVIDLRVPDVAYLSL